MPSSSDLVPAVVHDACIRARERFSFSSFLGHEETGTHLLRIRGYSTVEKQLGRGKFVESQTFRAGGHSWRMEYYPNGVKNSKSGHACVALRHKGISFLGIGNKLLGDAASATAEYKVSILDRHGNWVYSNYTIPCHYKYKRPGQAYHMVVMDGTAEERSEKLCLAEEDTLFVKCDVTVQKIDRESNIKFFCRRLLD